MKKALILANPSSGKKLGREMAVFTEEKFEAAGWDCIVKVTQDKSDITKYTSLACQEKKDYLIIIGGDGTVSEVLNTLKHFDYRPTIGTIPTGTVNNIARGFGIELPIEKAVEQLINSRVKTCDVGSVNGQLFLSSISAGSVPETVWEVTDDMKERYGSLAYFIEGLKSLKNEETHEVLIELDGKSIIKEVSLLLVGVSHNISGINNFFEEATMNDGKLHLFLMNKTSLGEKIGIISRLMSEQNQELPPEVTIESFETARFSIRNKKNHVAMDGEKGPEFPLIVKVLPRFLTVLVPEHLI
ncbi:MAG: diacylglycerol kinase family lipid kinase [Alkalibacterium sp.]|nr:diacylglycerol kinase family lipid kinase [Alkalibacterium sp.]